MKFFFILLLLVSSTIFASTKFSNFIFFGDSLVDTGNFPASAQIVSNPSKATKHLTFDDYVTTLYIPISNPVNVDGKYLKIAKYAKGYKHKFSWPTVTPKSARQTQPFIAGSARKSRSMLWPEFLLSDLSKNNIVDSKVLIPRIALALGYNDKLNIHDSVNYAWISALTGKGCANEDLVNFKGACNDKSILKTAKQYIKVRTSNFKKRVRIPGLIAQVNWFSKDLKSKKVFINKDSAIFILVGGNDMNKSFAYLASGSAGKAWGGVEDLVAGTSHNVYLAMRKLAKLPGHKVKHIYLMTLFNPRWTPRVMHWSKSLQHLAGVFVGLYNSGLHLAAWRINHKYPRLHVEVVPMRDWFDDWAGGKGEFGQSFKAKTLGSACQASNIAYNQSVTPKDNCLGYLFWNAVHPTMQAEQLIAYKLGLILQQ